MLKVKGLPPYPTSVPRMVTNKGKWSSIGEHYMVLCFENIYKDKFEKIRPSWLTNPESNRCLELDCYNRRHNVAGEYNGKQHYEYTPYFHKTEKEFKSQQKRDATKRILCERNNVTLITVPYNVPQKKMQRFIYTELARKLVK